MPYSTKLEEKIDGLTSRWKGLAKRKMFGGTCYLLQGNMCFGLWKDFLIVRMGREQAAASLKRKNVRAFDITGHAMAGWVMVEEAGWKNPSGLAKWLDAGKAFARTLPEKQKAKKKKTLREWRG